MNSQEIHEYYLESGIKKVTSDSLVPQQQVKSASRILRSADCYQQKFIKFPNIGIFHSYSELLHAAILESDSSVTSFIPQPFQLKVGVKRYVPDCFYVKNGKRMVIELKPRGEFKQELQIPITVYLKFKGFQFEVVSNESIIEQETLALNWLYIIRTLICSRNEDTEREELKLMDKFIKSQELDLGDLVDIGNRINNRAYEIALYRMAHRGILKIDLADENINFSTKVELCT